MFAFGFCKTTVVLINPNVIILKPEESEPNVGNIFGLTPFKRVARTSLFSNAGMRKFSV
jgi:hypothetical protein